MQASPKILSKIRKLLRLATSPNVHEASRAKEEADRLMGQHNVSAADVASDVVEIIDEKYTDHTIRLARALALYFRCSLLVNKRNQIAIKGRPDKVADAKRLHQMFNNGIADACEHMRHDPGFDLYCLSFREGFICAVTKRLLGIEIPAQEIVPVQETTQGEVEPVKLSTDTPPKPESQLAPALEDFASRFRPDDRTHGVMEFCTNAFNAGNIYGSSVAIDKPKKEIT